jgi:anti-sigma factor RsiW
MAEEGFDAFHNRCPDGVRRDAAGWVLGALDAATARRFREHLPTCAVCQATVADLQPAAQALLSPSAAQPPGYLAVATLARVRRAADRNRELPENDRRRTAGIHQPPGINISKRPQLGTVTSAGIDKLPGPIHSG